MSQSSGDLIAPGTGIILRGQRDIQDFLNALNPAKGSFDFPEKRLILG
jgi:hypothetical protein